MFGSKADIEPAFSNLKNYGFAVANINYRLMPMSGNSGEGFFPDGNNDCLAAIRHLKANAEKYHVDTNRVAVTGFSAGGYFTAFIVGFSGSNYAEGLQEDMSLGNGHVSSRVHAGVSWSGLSDFSKLKEQSGKSHDDLAGRYLGGKLDDNTPNMISKLKQQNPLNYVCANTPPILMSHGTSDGTVPWQQSEMMVNKVNEVKGAGYAIFDKIQGADHGNFQGKETMIKDFLLAKLPQPSPTSVLVPERVIK